MNLVIDIPEAMYNISNVLVPSLQGYKCLAGGILYDFEMYTGGFCQSYPLQKENSTKKCLRLWTNDVSREDNLQHIKEVADYFQHKKPYYVVKYDYVDRAFRLNDGTVIPGVVMDWIEGDTLINYVKKNYRNSALMEQLAESFHKMVNYFHYHGIAHGDLSGENIIVDNRGNLSLVDYDSFYVRGMARNILQPTKGQGAYQHPKRMFGDDRYLNKDMDNFSQQVIYLSLIAIAAKPSVFNEDSDCGLVFQETDLINGNAFKESATYRAISEIKDHRIHYLLDCLRTDLEKDLSQVRSLFTILDLPEMPADEPEYEWEEHISTPYSSRSLGKEEIATFHVNKNYCPMCGTKYPSERSSFCPQCGHPCEVKTSK